MLEPEFKLEEQLVDARSNQIAYKLTISNKTSKAFRLISVEPRVPVGAELIEITDSSLAQANAQKVRLLEDLNSLLRQYLWVTSSSFRMHWVEQQRAAVKDMLSFNGFLSLYIEFIFFRKSSVEQRMKREFAREVLI